RCAQNWLQHFGAPAPKSCSGGNATSRGRSRGIIVLMAIVILIERGFVLLLEESECLMDQESTGGDHEQGKNSSFKHVAPAARGNVAQRKSEREQRANGAEASKHNQPAEKETAAGHARVLLG